MPVPESISRFPTFNPSLAVVNFISRTPFALVQTIFPHTFLAGESVRMIIPEEYGMTQINKMVLNIRFVPAPPTSFFLLDIDTTYFDQFVVPAVPTQLAQAVPVGENALMLTGAFRNVLPY